MKTRKTYSLGSLCVGVGCAMRIFQILCVYVLPSLYGNRIIYMAMLCLLVGGFAVLIYEKKGRASLFAVGATVSALMTTVMGNMSDGGDSLRVLSALFLYAMFVFAALLMLMKRSGWAKIAGGLTLLLAAGLVVCTLCPVPGAIVTATLCTAYAAVGIGLNV